MISLFLRGPLAACLFLLTAAPTLAQQPSPATTTRVPPSAQTQRVQELLQSSGLSLDQLRRRLRAEGYPENTLDAYYSGRPTTAVPDTGVFSAIRALRLEEMADSVRRRQQERGARDTTPKFGRGRENGFTTLFRKDSELLDSLQVAIEDSLTRAALIELLRSRD